MRFVQSLNLFVLFIVNTGILSPKWKLNSLNFNVYSALSEIASSVGAISRSRPSYEGTPIPDLLVLLKSY